MCVSRAIWECPGHQDIKITRSYYATLQEATVIKEEATMKDCLIIGPVHTLCRKEVVELLKKKILTVTERAIHFNENPNIIGNWFTTLSRSVDMRRRKPTKTYNPQDYPRYDNYDAVECKFKNDIPIDYQGKIGIPDSFWFYYPELDYEVLEHRGDLKLNGKTVYERLIIRRKN